MKIKPKRWAKHAVRKIEIARPALLTFSSTNTAFPKLTFILTRSFSRSSPVRRKSNFYMHLKPSEGIRQIAKEFPNCHTTLGLSNVSFGIKPYARLVLNSARFSTNA